MNPTRIALPYGRQELPVEIPGENLLGVYYPESTAGASDGRLLLDKALARPTGAPPLRASLRPGQKVAIVTSDLTRPTPSAPMLAALSRELDAAGIPDEDVLIILALGLHRPMTPAEIEAAVSPQILQRYRIVNHDPGDVIYLGETSSGTPVEFFRPLVEADVRICLGNIEFHYFAGYSGGAKAILPGCASPRTITANHAHMVEPAAVAGRIADNPVRLDLEEGAAMLGIDFILNVVVDGEHHITAAFAGDWRAAHRQGCELIAQRGRTPIPRLADIVIAGAGGYPKDINFYQAHKALENAKYFVRPGGIIILAAECGEGIGNKTMERWLLEIRNPEEALSRIRQEFVIGGHKVAALALIEQRAAISIISAMPLAMVQQMGFSPFPNLPAALEAALARLGAGSQIIVLPEASSILPKLDAETPAPTSGRV